MSVNIYSLTEYPALSELLLIVIATVHVALISISIVVIGLAIWSRWNHPQWAPAAYWAVGLAVAYLVMTFFLFG